MRCVLTVNGGSSSIKFALHRADAPTVRLLSGKIERIGLPRPTLTIRDGSSKTAYSAPFTVAKPFTFAARGWYPGWIAGAILKQAVTSTA